MTKESRKILSLMREQYEERLYRTLLEIEVKSSGGRVLIGAGLAVKNKNGEKFTVHSVQGTDDDIKINLISSANTQLKPGVVPSGSPPESGEPVTQVDVKTFEREFEEA